MKAKKILIRCPGCQSNVKLKNAPSGKKFKCPECAETIGFRCPDCGARTKLKDALRAKKFKCSKCDVKIKFETTNLPATKSSVAVEGFDPRYVDPAKDAEEQTSSAASSKKDTSKKKSESVTKAGKAPAEDVANQRDERNTTQPAKPTDLSSKGTPTDELDVVARERQPAVAAAEANRQGTASESEFAKTYIAPEVETPLSSEDKPQEPALQDSAANGASRSLETKASSNVELDTSVVATNITNQDKDTEASLKHDRSQQDLTNNDFADDPTIAQDYGKSGVSTNEQFLGTVEPAEPTSFGRYEIKKVLGKGAFGAVYLSFDTQLERQVAIKAPRLDVDSDTVEREFLAEARQLAKLNHAGIVSVYDVGIDSGQCYIVSDYLEGSDLNQWLLQNKPTWQQATQIAADIALALAHAHSHRVVHRDLKPANVIMTEGMTPVIVDFGLALSDAAISGAEKGMLAGTPSFMAPEQTLGEGHRIDGRTDIYALGVILYKMLAGQLPHRSKNINELFRQIQEDEPQPPRQVARDIPRQLEAICLKAMGKKLSDRYITADDVARDLSRVLAPSGSGSHSQAPLAPPSMEETVDYFEKESDSSVRSAGSRKQPGLSSVKSSLTASSRSVSRSREAARRRITALQCTCRVFESDEILDALDEEEQSELLTEFQGICRKVVVDHQGSIVQTTAEGLLVCFGFPIAREDSTRQAVHAGLKILEDTRPLIERLKTQHEINLEITVTAHSDHAVVSEKGETLTLTGQIRKVVSRLTELSQANSVVLSDATHQLVDRYFECESLGRFQVKGMGDIELHAVRGTFAKDHIEAADIGGKLTQLIGRDREVGLMFERWEQACEGMGQVVLLIGEAGLGKSRLVHVLKEHVKEQSASGHDVTADRQPIIEWRTTQNHQNSALYPAIECLERLLGFEPSMTPAERLDLLVEHLAKLSLDGDEEIALLASLLSIPLGGRYPLLDLPPQQQKDKTLHLLLDWMRECANEKAMLFVVEDLHWVDPSTLEFLELLVQEGMNDSVLSLLTFRPEFQTPWSSLAHQTSVALNRLTKKQVGQMIAVRSGIKDIPQDVIDQFVERTDGVPLFVEEFASMIIEKAGNRGLDGFSIDEIPATLQDLLLARLDRMASNVELVQLAAAIGREFRYDIIEVVSDMTAEELQAELGLLVSSELLNQRGRFPQTRYTFKHALIQDAAYDSLVRKKRIEVHLQIANVLESLFPDISEPNPELVAHHYTQANIPEKAVDYWERAGLRSLERYTHREAIGHLSNGLAQLNKLDESPQRNRREVKIRTSLGVPLQATLGYSAPDVEANYVRAHELCGETPEAFPVLYGLFRYFMLQAKYPRAIELGEQLVRLADVSKEPAGVVAANRAIASTLVYKGDHSKAVPHLQKVIELKASDEIRTEFYSFDVVDPWITSLSYLSWAKWLLGFPDQAAVYSSEAVATAEGLKHPFSMALGLSFSQWLHQFNRDIEATRNAADKALTIAQDQGFAFWIGWCQVLRGWARSKQGESADGIDEIREGIVAWRKQGSELGCHYYYALLAEACADAGRADDAMQALDDGQRFSDETGEGYYLAEIKRLRGKFTLEHDPAATAKAETLFREAFEIAASQEAKSLELRAAMSLARMFAESGQKEEAHKNLAATYNWFTEGLDSHDLKKAKAMLDRFEA